MKKRAREMQGFEMTPLIDVVFLLLIFFMVSSVFKKDELALLLNLPGSEAADKKKSHESLTLELSSTEVAFNGKKVVWDDLDALLNNVKKKDMPVDLRVDGEVKYDRVVALMDKLKKYGLTNLSLVSGHR